MKRVPLSLAACIRLVRTAAHVLILPLASLGRDDIDEHAFVVVPQIGEIVVSVNTSFCIAERRRPPRARQIQQARCGSFPDGCSWRRRIRVPPAWSPKCRY